MKKIFINGKFLCQKTTGVQRYAIEIIKCLDDMVNDEISFAVITPSKEYIVNELPLKKIEMIEVKGKPNYYWEQIKLANYCKKHKPDDLLNLCNIAPIMFPGSCTIHDLGCIDAPNGFSWKQRFIYKFINKRNIKKYKHLFTVSNTMKQRLEDYYKIDGVIVTYNGYEHMLNVTEKKPDIALPEHFYFTLGSLNPNKNFKAILKIAKNEPNNMFVITGKKAKSFADEEYENLPNVIFTGYLTDSEIKYMYSHCQAFLFPSLYEGFGIPPMEALASGCQKVICNDIPVLREVYDGMCAFVNFDGNVVLPDDFTNNVGTIKYSWAEAANIILNTLK